MKLDIFVKNGVAVIQGAPQKFDYTVCTQFQREIAPTLDQGVDALLIDLTGVVFLDSSAIGALITLRNRLLKTKGVVALCAISPQVAKVIRITDLHKVFEIFDNQDAALAALTKA